MTTVTLTVVYDSSGTWDFSSTDSSVTGVSGTAITVTDGTNYYYYAPATDTLGTSLSGGTWQTVVEYEYAENTASGYVITDIKLPNYDTVEIKFNLNSLSNIGTSSTVRDVINVEASRINSGNMAVSFVRKDNTNDYTPYLGTTVASSSSLSINTDYVGKSYFVSGTQNVWLNGNSIGTNTISYTVSSASYSYLFCAPSTTTGTSVGFNMDGKIYYAKYSLNDNLVRDYVFVKTGSTSRVLDKVNYNLLSITNTLNLGGTYSDLTYTHTVQGSPSVKVFNATSDTWVDGTPYVFNGTSWVEADAVYVYVNGSWVEKT